MHRIYVDPGFAESFSIGDVIEIPAAKSRRTANASGPHNSETVALFCGDGREWLAELKVDDRTGLNVNAELLEVSQPDVEMPIEISMMMALTPTDRYQQALAKCTELGAAEFVPFVSDRVSSKTRGDFADRIDRCREEIVQAAEESGRLHVPTISEIQSFEDALTRQLDRDTSIIFLWEGANEPSLWEVANSLSYRPRHPVRTVVVVGPVDGFTETEVEFAESLGVCVASLGPRVLRTDTASIAAMSLLAQAFG